MVKDTAIDRPDKVWAIDISYIPMKRGFMYLTAVIDWYSRYVVGAELFNTLEAETQTYIVDKQLERHNKPHIINSDQGSQYTCSAWVDYLRKRDIRISMDGKGRATDNAVIERFFRTIKQECIYIRPADNVRELRAQIKEYVSYYNYRRSHQGIGRKKPVSLYQNKEALT